MNREIANETRKTPTRKATAANTRESSFAENHEIGAVMTSVCGGIQSGLPSIETKASAANSQKIPNNRNPAAWNSRRLMGDVRPVYSPGVRPVQRLKAREKTAVSEKPT